MRQSNARIAENMQGLAAVHTPYIAVCLLQFYMLLKLLVIKHRLPADNHAILVQLPHFLPVVYMYQNEICSSFDNSTCPFSCLFFFGADR